MIVFYAENEHASLFLLRKLYVHRLIKLIQTISSFIRLSDDRFEFYKIITGKHEEMH